MAAEHPGIYKSMLKSRILRKILPSLAPSPSSSRFCLLPRKLKSAEKRVLKQHCATVVTPKVASIAEGLFSQTLHVVDLMLDPERVLTPTSAAYKVHHSDPVSMTWGEEGPGEHWYKSVIIDGTTYSV